MESCEDQRRRISPARHLSLISPAGKARKRGATGKSPDEYAAFIRCENDMWRESIKLSGIKSD
jgi:hypothetical protein